MDLGKILDGTPEPSAVLIAEEGGVQNRSGDYQLGVPLTAFEKQLADQVISSHYSDILKFYETQDTTMIESLETLYQNAQYSATHPFLLIDHYMPHNLLLKEMPDRISKSSGKFEILYNIIDLIGNLKLQVGLISQAGKTMDLLEAVLLGKKVNYHRHSGASLRPMDSPNPRLSTVRLISSSKHENEDIFTNDFKLDLLIAFDQSFLEVEPDYLTKIRGFNRTQPVPLLRLIPFNSIEHVCFKIGIDLLNSSKVEFFRKILAPIVILRGKIGSPPIDLQYLYNHSLKPLLPWFKSLCQEEAVPWPLPDLPDITEYSSLDVEKSLLTEVGIEAPDEKKDSEPADYYQAKRLKRETNYVSNSSIDPIYDSDLNVSRTNMVLTHGLLVKLDEAVDEIKLKNEEIQCYREKDSNRQFQLESALEAVSTYVDKVSELKSKLQSSERKGERLQTEIVRANDRLESTTNNLEETRKIIDAGPPEISAFEEQTRKVSELSAEVKRLHDRLDSKNIENDYMRGEYQKASAAAIEAQSKVLELEKVNIELEKRASGEAARLRQLSFFEERAVKDEQIKELQARLALNEEKLKRLTEADKQPLSGTRGSRFASRASSVPRRTRSPNSHSRVGSPSVDSQNGSHPLQTVTKG